jgi:hypothetical protein
MMDSLGIVNDPSKAFSRVHASPSDGGAWFSFEHSQDYLADAPSLLLQCFVAKVDGNTWCRISKEVEQPPRDPAEVPRLRDAINVSRPLPLTPVRIPKPWGAEIWFTGIEKRGVSRIGNTPIPWLLDLTGDACCGTEPPLLLKILDPLPDELLGDLYFELHEEKVEVYVVTSIDKSAWPEGSGYIRYGFNEQKLAQYDSREAFKHHYLESVQAYREVRREVDRTFDEFRIAEGIALDEVIAPDRMNVFRDQLPDELVQREEVCRVAMNAFTSLEPLKTGDIVRVTPFTPHSLLHGVRVVEFQTPHYERFILSFGQKVLTQSDWDTEAAIEKVDWNATFDKHVEQVTSTDDFEADRVADFDEFKVMRLTIKPNGSFVQDLNTYALVMGIEGRAEVNEVGCNKEEALLVPRSLGRLEVHSADGCCILLAVP